MKTEELLNLTDIEDEIYILINSNHPLHEWVQSMLPCSRSSVLHDMRTIYRTHIKDAIETRWPKPEYDLGNVFLHLADSSGRLHEIDGAFNNYYGDAPKIGDIVYHVNDPKNLVGQIYEDADNRWKVHYLKKSSHGRWLKRNCRISNINDGPLTNHVTNPIINKNINLKPLFPATVHYGTTKEWEDAVKLYYTKAPADVDHRPRRNQIQNDHWFDIAWDIWKRAPSELPEEKPHTLVIDNISDLSNELLCSTMPLGIRPFNNKPENTMQAEIIHRTEINGKDIDSMTSSDILHHISNAEDGIAKLKKRNQKSTFVKQEVKRLQDFVKEAYQLLDTKFAEPEDK